MDYAAYIIQHLPVALLCEKVPQYFPYTPTPEVKAGMVNPLKTTKNLQCIYQTRIYVHGNNTLMSMFFNFTRSSQ